MNSSHRIRVYLEQHKVGPLFEDLMSKLISEMPSEPVPFLIQILQKKIYHVPQTVMNVPQLRRSLGNLTSTLEIEKLPIQRKQSSSVIKRNSRPVTPSVMIAPKKAVTICYPIRTVSSKPMKAVTTGAPPKSGENRRSPTPERFVSKESKSSYDFNSMDSNFPRWRPGGYNGPVIPGSVFMEDPFKDEIININQFDNGPKFDFSQPEYSKKILDERGICSDRSHSTFKTNKQFTQESSYDSVDGNNEQCYVEVTEEETNNDDNDQWNFNICSVCAKVMNNEDSVKKTLKPCQGEQQNQSQLKAKNDIPLLEIPKETNKVKDDLFASIRSLPLPPSPKNTNYQSRGKNWYESTLESLYASSDSWKI